MIMNSYLNGLKYYLKDRFEPADPYRNPDADTALYDQAKDVAALTLEQERPKDAAVISKANSQSVQIKRLAAAALPLVSLYQPIGKFVSISSTSLRILTNAYVIFIHKKSQKVLHPYVLQAALGTVALAGTFFHFKICLLTTNFADVVHSAIELGRNAKDQSEKKKNIKDALQLLAAVSYGTTLVAGSLEIILISYLIQIVLQAYLGQQDLQNGRFIEGICKLIMGIARSYQTKNIYHLIQKRNDFFKDQVFQEFFSRIRKRQQAYQLLRHRLAGNLSESVENQDVKIEGLDADVHSAGACFHGYGKSLVKGMNIVFKNVEEDGKEFVELKFKISYAHRAKLQQVLDNLENLPEEKIQEFLKLAGSQADNITINTKSCSDPAKFDCWDEFFGLKEMFYVDIASLGSIFIGCDSRHLGLYNQVVVKIEKNKNLFDLYEMLSLLGLEDAVLESVEEDVQRLKLGHLYHNMFPKEAYKLDREDVYADLSVAKLKAEMIKRAPEAKAVFERYLDKMQLEELLPGMKRYAISGLEKEAYEIGGRFLAVNIIADNKKDIVKRTASILKTGLFSANLKEELGFSFKGLNGGFSNMIGGSDGVFAQLITENACKAKMDVDELEYSWFNGKMILLIDLQALRIGTYQYHTDNFGDKRAFDSICDSDSDSDFEDDEYWISESYPTRENILEFIKRENEDFSEENEVIVFGRVLPQWIKGVIIQNEQLRQELITFLIHQKIVVDGQILGQKVASFFHVTDHFSENLMPFVQV